MRAKLPLALALGVLLSPFSAAAQEEPSPAARGVYYRCDQSKEGLADLIVEGTVAPVLDGLVSGGSISSWGWLEHDVGGPWRRVLYWIAPDRNALLDATDQIEAEVPDVALQQLSAICPSHDDYIWTSITGSEESAAEGAERPAAALSTYYECDITREARADTLVMEAFAPIFNRHVAAGHIDGWSWIGHSIGGKLRRAALFDGPDHKSILNARQLIIADIASEAAGAIQEFGQICPAHEDYLWNIQISRP